MSIIEAIKKKANKAFRLSQQARTEDRKKKLRELYRHYYQVYQKQKVFDREMETSCFQPPEIKWRYENQVALKGKDLR